MNAPRYTADYITPAGTVMHTEIFHADNNFDAIAITFKRWPTGNGVSYVLTRLRPEVVGGGERPKCLADFHRDVSQHDATRMAERFAPASDAAVAS